MEFGQEHDYSRGQGERARSPVILLTVPVIVMIAALAAYTLWFARTERTLYHADQVAYWSFSRSLAELMRHDPVAATRAVVKSVAENDVNLLPAAPISLLMLVFGGSRLVYLLGVIVVYGSATALALIFALNRLGPRPPPWAVSLAFALLPTVLQPIFIGYLGIGGVALALVVLALVLPVRSAPPSVRTLALAGFTLGVLVLFRRWWGIWGVAFLLVLMADAAWRYLRSDDHGFSSLVRSFRTFWWVSAGSGVTVIALAAPVIVHKLRTDYADRFTAYTYDTLAARVGSVVDHYGLIGLLAVAFCAFILLREPTSRSIGAFLVAQLGVTFAVMVQIQDHTPQHWWLYSAPALLIIGFAVTTASTRLPDPKIRAMLAVLTTAGIVLVGVVFLPVSTSGRSEFGTVLPADVIRPQVRNDLREINRMLSYLDHQIGPGAARVYVLASSGVISDHVLAFSNLSLGVEHRSRKAIIEATHIDRWHGFPRGLLVADLVVVADPVQVHLRPEDQRVIGEPAKSFLDGIDIAHAFTPLAERFTLDGGVEVTVFQRRRPNTRDEVEELSGRLRSFYPDRPDIFSPE